MRKCVKFAIYYLVAFLVLALNIIFCIKDRFFYSIEDLPEERFLCPAMSVSSDNYVARAYEVVTPEGSGVRVEVTQFDPATDKVSKRNVYWKVGQSSVTLAWDENEDILYVDSMMLNIAAGDSYDCRKIATEK